MNHLEKIKESLDFVLNLNEQELEEINESTTLEYLELDSLDNVEFVMSIEEMYGIEIPDSDADAFTSVKDIIVYLEENVK